MEQTDVLLRLAISLSLGLLIGLQRERVEAPLAGIRTFPLITLFGSICALLSHSFGGWTLALGGAAIGALLTVGHYSRARVGSDVAGLTTEVAALLMYGIGAYLMVGYLSVAVTLSGCVAILLYLKEPMHRFASAVGTEDFRAIMQFVLISLVILPVLPDRPYGPYDSLNPREIWKVVVLIVGIGLSGYVLSKFFQGRTGTLLTGLLGGLVSSTATTLSYARQARENRECSTVAATIVIIASAIAYARMLIEVAVVAPQSFEELAPPLLAMLAWMLVLSFGVSATLLNRTDGRLTAAPARNPAQLKSAVAFGSVYAVVSFAVAATQANFHGGTLYWVAAVSGLVDVDAITLSTARLTSLGRIPSEQAWRLIIAASIGNLFFKGALAITLGPPAFRRQIAAAFSLAAFGALLLVGFWEQ